VGQLDEDLVRRREHELWAAAQRKDLEVFRRYFSPDITVFCNNYHCSGEEYLMALPGYDMIGYTIEQYETVLANEERIQNTYLVHLNMLGSKEMGTCHITSTWMRQENEWKIIFHMGTLTY